MLQLLGRVSRHGLEHVLFPLGVDKVIVFAQSLYLAGAVLSNEIGQV